MKIVQSDDSSNSLKVVCVILLFYYNVITDQLTRVHMRHHSVCSVITFIQSSILVPIGQNKTGCPVIGWLSNDATG